MQTDPNARQVGGSHYQSNSFIQHWDIIELFQVPYLEGNGSKYLSRWHLKNGVQDLEKALHYVEKLLSRVGCEELGGTWPSGETLRPWAGRLVDNHRGVRPKVPFQLVQRFCGEQGCDKETTDIMGRLLSWRHFGDVEVVRDRLAALILRVRHPISLKQDDTGVVHPRGFDPAQDA